MREKTSVSKLPPILPPELLPLLARHMETFLVFHEAELETKLRQAPEPRDIVSGQASQGV